jgi:hypothetical protein
VSPWQRRLDEHAVALIRLARSGSLRLLASSLRLLASMSLSSSQTTAAKKSLDFGGELTDSLLEAVTPRDELRDRDGMGRREEKRFITLRTLDQCVDAVEQSLLQDLHFVLLRW